MSSELDKWSRRIGKAKKPTRPKTRVEYSKRQVIENQVPPCHDKGKVAIICTEDDLDMLICGLESLKMAGVELNRKRDRYVEDLELLRAKAFPNQNAVAFLKP